MNDFKERRGLWWLQTGMKDCDITLRDHEDWIYEYIPHGGDKVVVDVGAFVGLFTLEAARVCGSVIAFEPNIVARKVFAENIKRNAVNNVIVLPYAVGSRERFVSIVQQGGATHVGKHPRTIQQVYLDRVLQHESRIDFIKIDVEGYEVEVIYGATQTIERCKPTILVEVHSHYKNFTNNGNLLDEAIKPLGYSSRRVWENSPAYFYNLYEPLNVDDAAH